MRPSSQRPQRVFQVEVPAARSAGATPLTVLRLLPCYRLYFLCTPSPGGHRRRARCQALRRRPALPGARPPSQPLLLPPYPPPALLPRATRLYLFRAVLTMPASTFRTRSRRPCTRLTSTPPRCSSQRWPASAGPSRVAERAAGIPGPREQWTVSLPVAPLLRRPPACCLCSVLCGVSFATAGLRPRMPPLPADRRLAFVNAVGGCILGAGHCLRPVWLSQRLK